MSESRPDFVMCIDNRGFTASLEVRKVYRCEPDAKAGDKGLLRVIDDSGEDYLYPKELFEPASGMEPAVRPQRRRR